MGKEVQMIPVVISTAFQLATPSRETTEAHVSKRADPGVA